MAPVSRDLMPDFVHPTAKGYQIRADAMQPVIDRPLGEVSGENQLVSIISGRFQTLLSPLLGADKRSQFCDLFGNLLYLIAAYAKHPYQK
jgi:hypothetical protein